MKTISSIIIIFKLMAGFAGLLAVLESAYFLGSVLLLAVILLDVGSNMLFGRQYGIMGKFSYSNDILCYIGVVAIILWKLFLRDYGAAGIGTGFVFVSSGLIWITNNSAREKESRDYRGLYLPAAAGLILAVTMIITGGRPGFLKYSRFMSVLVMLLSFLMIADIKYMDIAKLKVEKKYIIPAVLAVIVVAAGIIYDALFTLAGVFLVYVLSGIAADIFRYSKR